jgi:hypothetical protein
MEIIWMYSNEISVGIILKMEYIFIHYSNAYKDNKNVYSKW